MMEISGFGQSDFESAILTTRVDCLNIKLDIADSKSDCARFESGKLHHEILSYIYICIYIHIHI